MLNTPLSEVTTSANATTNSPGNVPMNPIQKHDMKDCCNKPEGCGNCMKGGMPLKKEVLSFITLALIGVTTVLAVLLVTEKRAKLAYQPAPVGETAKVAMMKYEMPAVQSVREVIQLPNPKLDGDTSVEAALQSRRSRRFFSEKPVTMQELSQILWSAQGVTDAAGHRAAPSARSAYPFSVYVVVRNVESLDAGLYVYNPKDHTLGSLGLANAGEKLIAAGVQENSQKAPVVLALVAAPAIMQAIAPTNDPLPNINLEAGHIGQNIYLQVEALQMATVVTGGFDKNKVAAALELDPVNQVVSYLVPFGHIGEAPTEEAAGQ